MGIARKEFDYKAANWGRNIYGCVWMDESTEKYRGIIHIVHGMSEHILRYEEFAIFLAEYGFIVCGNDHSGHGRSVSDDIELGFFGEEESWKYLVEDMNYIMNLIKGKFGNLPYFIIGHSMGSFLARQFAFLYGNEIEGAIFLGTSGTITFIDKAIDFSKKGVNTYGPRVKNNSLNKMVLHLFNMKCNPQRTDYDWISRYDEIIDKFVKDKRCGFAYTFAGYRELFLFLKTVSDDEWAKGINKKLPILLISGYEDPFGEYGKVVEEVYKGLLKAGCKNVMIKLYDSVKYEGLNDVNKYAVYRFILKWFNEILE